MNTALPRAGDERPGVMVDFDDHVVEVVDPGKSVAWFTGRASHGMIVPSVCWVFAPRIFAANAANRQQCPRLKHSIGAPPQANRVKPATRGAAIAFALVGLDAGPAKRDGYSRYTGEQPSL